MVSFIFQMTTLYLNLSQAIETGEGHWELAYNFTSAYNVGDVSAESVYHIAEQIRMNNTEVFGLYHAFYSVLYNKDLSTCNDTCHIRHYCSIAAVDLTAFDACTGDIYSFQPDMRLSSTITQTCVHATRFSIDISMLVYILASFTIVLCTIMFAVCTYRTQQLHSQFKYDTIKKPQPTC